MPIQTTKPKTSQVLLRILIIFAVQVVAFSIMTLLLDGVQVDNLGTAILVVLVIALLNAVLWPILSYILVPFAVLTLGLVALLLNGFIIWLAAVSALPYIPELVRKPGTQAFFDLQEHSDGQTYPGLSIIRFDGGLFFVNADALGDRLRDVRIHADPPLTGVIISMEGVNFIDTEGADILKKIAKVGQELGIDLHIARPKPQVLEVLHRDGVVEKSATSKSNPISLQQLSCI